MKAYPFAESVTLVAEVPRTAPGYAVMDFTTRDQYRARIELLSRRSTHSEIDVAREAVLLARNASLENGRSETLPGVPDLAENDPGYYIVAGGRQAFEKRLGFRVPLKIRL